MLVRGWGSPSRSNKSHWISPIVHPMLIHLPARPNEPSTGFGGPIQMRNSCQTPSRTKPKGQQREMLDMVEVGKLAVCGIFEGVREGGGAESLQVSVSDPRTSPASQPAAREEKLNIPLFKAKCSGVSRVHIASHSPHEATPCIFVSRGHGSGQSVLMTPKFKIRNRQKRHLARLGQSPGPNRRNFHYEARFTPRWASCFPRYSPTLGVLAQENAK